MYIFYSQVHDLYRSVKRNGGEKKINQETKVTLVSFGFWAARTVASQVLMNSAHDQRKIQCQPE
jgi:hypothetical protein